ncbi:hypothetical protein [Flavobacterium algicola]|uniref:hypothetical protein n=1 Tax=Flavobacterium algicola TaxID=556529 RepID=UPI001EFE7B5F|nr:hypothetical protein [Flavobacterium algicola]MCG9792663.1 hypothetical protein [Flavobacterium algicola]
MQHITGIPRNQLFINSLKETITSYNVVCFIVAFVDVLSLKSLGFSVSTIKTEGRPTYGQGI